jgi:hypothetical protein
VDEEHRRAGGFEEVIGTGEVTEGAGGLVDIGLGGEVQFGQRDGAIGGAAGLGIAKGVVAGEVESAVVEGKAIQARLRSGF